VAKDIYRGVQRILLVLHHDFPEFLAENHYRLCNVIPAHCTQLRNLVLSAYPTSFPELPDPFTAGLKVDRLPEVRNSPVVSGDVEAPLRRAGVKDIVDAALGSGPSDDYISAVVKAISNPSKGETGVGFASIHVDTELISALVLYIGMNAIASVAHKGGPTFVITSTQAQFLHKLVRNLQPEARYYFLSSMVNQLRYPNSHTHYFSYALLFLFGDDHNDQEESDIRQQITRVLLERLIVHRPHPWGLIITLLELLKNPTYMFWELPFIKAAPEVRI
jgi:CCR4-NOT transcription complex subunit 1